MTIMKETHYRMVLEEVDSIFKLLQRNGVKGLVNGTYVQTFDNYNSKQLYIANSKVYWMADSDHEYEVCETTHESSIREQITDKFYLYKAVTTNVLFNI